MSKTLPPSTLLAFHGVAGLEPYEVYCPRCTSPGNPDFRRFVGYKYSSWLFYFHYKGRDKISQESTGVWIATRCITCERGHTTLCDEAGRLHFPPPHALDGMRTIPDYLAIIAAHDAKQAAVRQSRINLEGAPLTPEVMEQVHTLLKGAATFIIPPLTPDRLAGEIAAATAETPAKQYPQRPQSGQPEPTDTKPIE